MSHGGSSTSEPINADSFLDIVASVVSVMIIMVVMTGLKIKSSPVDASTATDVVPVNKVLANAIAEEQAIQADLAKVDSEIASISQQANAQKSQCRKLTEAIASRAEHSRSLEGQVSQYSGQVNQLETALAEASRSLEASQRELSDVDNAAAPCVQVECYPTPLSRTVDKHEVHFRLRNGRVTPLPIEALLARLKSDAQSKVERLRDVPEITEVIGPENGFWLRYTLERVESSPEMIQKGGYARVFVQLKRWTLLPESEDIGEPIDRALAEGSDFRRALASARAQGAMITIWTYPDSFGALRQIKKDLYQSGLAVAARPLPEGILISGSPHGSKSAAE